VTPVLALGKRLAASARVAEQVSRVVAVVAASNAAQEQASRRLLRQGAPAAVVALQRRHHASAEVTEQACVALQRLAVTDKAAEDMIGLYLTERATENRAALLGAGALDAAMGAMREHASSAAVVEAACGVLCELSAGCGACRSGAHVFTRGPLFMPRRYGQTTTRAAYAARQSRPPYARCSDTRIARWSWRAPVAQRPGSRASTSRTVRPRAFGAAGLRASASGHTDPCGTQRGTPWSSRWTRPRW
jgi:hypothetical protein